jgi:hypothetical protein
MKNRKPEKIEYGRYDQKFGERVFGVSNKKACLELDDKNQES